MATWDEIFREEKYRFRAPEAEIPRFITFLETVFSERPLRLWDLCCGAGRHTAGIAESGHTVFASDGAPSAVAATRKLLEQKNLQGSIEVADMTLCPWPEVRFHGVVSWDALHHNTLGNIQKSISVIFDRLLPGGLLMATLKSTKADSYGFGEQIEPNTFVCDQRPESGVPHHFFDEGAIRDILKEWELLILAEQVVTYAQRCENFLECNPFRYTTWNVLARKPH